MSYIINYSPPEFIKAALRLFQQQYEQVEVYRKFVNYLNIKPEEVRSPEDIPFIPVDLFKTHKIANQRKKELLVFQSSGTTGQARSRHYICRPEIYEKSFISGFINSYGAPDNYCILALLPSYLEREGSSLVYMMEKLISLTHHPDSGFYLDNFEKLNVTLHKLRKEEKKIILLGVSFALLEFARRYPQDLSGVLVMETGGMKGRGKELTRQELHQKLKKAFQLSNIHSEYGMTELLSQAYSKGEGRFFTPPWMKVLIKDIHDPFDTLSAGKGGRIDIIDLANEDSCAFISTSDLGKSHSDGSFEVLGRLDNSEVRGCNLLVI